MVQEVTLNGRPLDLDYYPSLEVGARPLYQTPIEIKGKMVHGVNINGYDYPPADPSCVLYLPGLPGYGATIWDRSKEGNHGTITGATWIRLPSGLWMLVYDGTDDHVNCGTGASLDLTGAFTLEAWAYTTDVTKISQEIINKDGIAADSRAYNLGFLNNNLRLQIFSQKNSVNNFIMTWADQIANNTWYHIIGTWDGGLTDASTALYINGVSGGTCVETGDFAALQAVTEALLIGARKASAPEREVFGRIALPRIYNRALSAPEIQNHFSREKHLFGVWRT